MRAILLLNDTEDEAISAAIELMEAHLEDLKAKDEEGDREFEIADVEYDLRTLTNFLHAHSWRFVSA